MVSLVTASRAPTNETSICSPISLNLNSRQAAFERRYEQAAAPFEWRFTRDDLALLMKKFAEKPDYQLAA